MADPRLSILLHQLTLAFDKRSWHGPNLLGSLRGVSIESACWRPQPERHNIWEILVHCAYWKYRVCHTLSPDSAHAFSLKGSDWFQRPLESSSKAWKQDVDDLKGWHEKLMGVVVEVDPLKLDLKAGSGEFTVSELISGAAAHDFYHAGQIRLLRRMHGSVVSA